jgi:hypothetical protein
MKTITGLFDTYADAERAVMALKNSGIADDDISLISRDSERLVDHADTSTADGVGVGSGLGIVAGGAGGLLAGLGMLAIPGIGPVVAAGWLASTLAGAAAGAVVGGTTGGVIGALTGSDISEEDAHVYAESVRRGGTLVTARVHDDRVVEAQGLLDQAGRIDAGARRQTYGEGGWSEFDPNLPAQDPKQVEARQEWDDRERRRIGGL